MSINVTGCVMFYLTCLSYSSADIERDRSTKLCSPRNKFIFQKKSKCLIITFRTVCASILATACFLRGRMLPKSSPTNLVKNVASKKRCLYKHDENSQQNSEIIKKIKQKFS